MSTRNIVEPVNMDVCDVCALSSTNRRVPDDWMHLAVYPSRGTAGATVHLDVCGECWAGAEGELKLLRLATEKIAREQAKRGP